MLCQGAAAEGGRCTTGLGLPVEIEGRVGLRGTKVDVRVVEDAWKRNEFGLGVCGRQRMRHDAFVSLGGWSWVRGISAVENYCKDAGAGTVQR